jgi:hypothetical protein
VWRCKQKNENSGKPFVSQAEFARLRHVSRVTVKRWKADGDLVFGKQGLVDVNASIARLAERPVAMRKAAEDEASVVAERFLRESGAPYSLSEARRLRENYLAERARYELNLLTGTVMPRDDVMEVIMALVTTVNARLWGIPARAAVLLEGGQTHAEREEIVNALLEEAVEGLNNLNIEYVEERLSHKKKRRENGSQNHAARGHGSEDDRTDA